MQDMIRYVVNSQVVPGKIVKFKRHRRDQMSRSLHIDRRAFLRGLGGVTLALPVLDAMGAEVTDQIPRRFCALYTANGMSLPKAEHEIDEWSWFPAAGRVASLSSASRRTAGSVPQAVELHGRPVVPQRSESRSAYLFGDVVTGAPCTIRRQARSILSVSIRWSHSTPSSTAGSPHSCG